MAGSMRSKLCHRLGQRCGWRWRCSSTFGNSFDVRVYNCSGSSSYPLLLLSILFLQQVQFLAFAQNNWVPSYLRCINSLALSCSACWTWLSFLSSHLSLWNKTIEYGPSNWCHFEEPSHIRNLIVYSQAGGYLIRISTQRQVSCRFDLLVYSNHSLGKRLAQRTSSLLCWLLGSIISRSSSDCRF